MQKFEPNYCSGSQKLRLKNQLFSQGEQMEVKRPSPGFDEFAPQEKASLAQREELELNAR